MADRFSALNEKHQAFIAAQHLFFVATAGPDGRVNVSPKGMDSLRVIDQTKLAWLNLTGSGNETAAHIKRSSRMTIMFCSFERQPLILRVYGTAVVTHPTDEGWDRMAELFPHYPGRRQVFELNIDLVQTSCGYAVPHYHYEGERHTLTKWAEGHGADGIEAYWRRNNGESLDGWDTGI